VDTDNLGFVTEANGHLDSYAGSGWSTALGGTGCTPPMPVYANSVVYAAVARLASVRVRRAG
jgi:hypothetical protein